MFTSRWGLNDAHSQRSKYQIRFQCTYADCSLPVDAEGVLILSSEPLPTISPCEEDQTLKEETKSMFIESMLQSGYHQAHHASGLLVNAYALMREHSRGSAVLRVAYLFQTAYKSTSIRILSWSTKISTVQARFDVNKPPTLTIR